MMDSWTYEEKVNRLEEILEKGIHELCAFARDHNYLNFPYGKNEGPTPLISEQEFIQQGGLKCDDTEPTFSYEYGFDPLKFLSDYIVWAHPQSVENRLQAKWSAQERLAFRAAHAKRQLELHELLKVKVTQIQAGIEWGPLCVPVSFSTIKCLIKPYLHGIIYLQIAYDIDFQSIIKTYKILCPPEGVIQPPSELPISLSDGRVGSQSIEITGLSEKTVYYLRCAAITTETYPVSLEKLKSNIILLDNEKETEEILEISALLTSQPTYLNTCWTLPDDSFSMLPSSGLAENDGGSREITQGSDSVVLTGGSDASAPLDAKALLKLNFFGQLPIDSLQRMKYLVANQTADPKTVRDTLAPVTGPSPVTQLPLYYCLLGDLFTHTNQYQLYLDEAGYDYALDEKKQYETQVHLIVQKLLQCGEFTHALWNIAWRDSSPYASSALRLEETIYRQYRSDYKKYCKKHNIEESGAKKKPKRNAHNNASSNSLSNTAPPPPPVLRRPELTAPLSSLLQAFPLVPLKEPLLSPPQVSMDTVPSCRMLFRSVMIGSDVQLIILDYRKSSHHFSLGCDYLGKEQAEWLAYTLQTSTASWKVICSGKTFGVVASNTHIPSEIVAEENHELQGQPKDSEEGNMISNSYSFDSMVEPLDMLKLDQDLAGLQSQSQSPTAAAKAAANLMSAADTTATNPPNPTTPGGHSRSVQLLLPEEKKPADNHQSSQSAAYPQEKKYVHEKAHICLYDDCEEVYGRSKYSLQHVLADYQHKQIEAQSLPSVATAAGELNGVQTIPVSSGIVLLTSGITTFYTKNLTSEDTEHITVDQLGDAQCPSFVTSYYSLSSPMHNILPIDFSIANRPMVLDTLQEMSTTSTPLPMPYCVEIGLGQGNLYSVQAMAAQSSAMYHYLPGLEAYNYFLNAEDDAEENAESTHYTSSELALLPNGSLHVKLHDNVLPKDEYHDTTVKHSIPMFEFVLSLPTANVNGNDSDDQSVYVA